MNLELQSERLLLRPLSESDLDISVEILTDPQVMRYVTAQVMRYVTAAYTREQVAEEMPVALKRGGGGCIGIWCVVDRAAGEKLGTAVLLPIPIEEKDTNWDLVGGPDLPDREIEIGYMLKPKAWGKGYATEITKRLLKFAFEATPLEEIVAVTDPHNEASKSVLLKSGLRYEGMRRAYASDCPGYRVTRQQWLAENS
jgi:ribosomal-protein-alanine N-acetyltransferase